MREPRGASRSGGGRGRWWDRRVERREFLETLGLGLGALSLGAGCDRPPTERPNVLFVSVDDLNDWVGVLGGHPQVRTPHLDALASRGVLFSNAHCDAPACLPSRTAVLTGLRPSTTGEYGITARRLREALPDAVTLPQRFRASGYRVLGSGKVFHLPDSPSWDDYFEAPLPAPDSAKPLEANETPEEVARLMSWGIPGVPEEALVDPRLVAWASARLETVEAPFFLACGLHRPHLPWLVPKRFFDLYPIGRLSVPATPGYELDDIPPIANTPQGGPRGPLEVSRWKGELREGRHRRMIRAYLASISFADEMVGRLVAALDASRFAGRTIVVVWSDNGLHLGEKRHFGKSRLWEEATRVPLIIVAPGVSVAGGVCRRPVNLVDLFPTLLELCGVSGGSPGDGTSLVPLLRDPDARWRSAALTTHGAGNHAVRSERWRYIRYRDGSEELYDHAADPDERTNLAADATLEGVKAELAAWLPAKNAPPLASASAG